MKRKMWALIYGIELRGKTTDGRAEIYFDKKLAESYKGKQDELKPVIVTDEDLFKNSREVEKSLKSGKCMQGLYDNTIKLMDAFKKDRENWDGQEDEG